MKICAGYAALWGLIVLTVEPALAADLTPITVGAATFQVEVARTTEERQRGLMFRRELPRNQGMLFVQPPGPAVFWMKNTYIPLDLLYFDADGKLLEIKANTPPCMMPTCPIYPSATATVRYILEINAGAAAQRGLRVSDRLRLESDSRN